MTGGGCRPHTPAFRCGNPPNPPSPLRSASPAVGSLLRATIATMTAGSNFSRRLTNVVAVGNSPVTDGLTEKLAYTPSPTTLVHQSRALRLSFFEDTPSRGGVKTRYQQQSHRDVVNENRRCSARRLALAGLRIVPAVLVQPTFRICESQVGAAPTPPLSAALGLTCRRLATADNEMLGRLGLSSWQVGAVLEFASYRGQRNA